MKKLSTQILLLLLFAPSAFGATAARVIPGTNSRTGDAQTASVDVSQTNKSSVVSRAATVSNKARAASQTQQVVSRVTASNPDTAETVITKSNPDVSRSTQSRAPIARNANPADARAKLDSAVSTVGRNARVSSASINNNPTVRRMGLSLRPTTAEVGGRATIAGTDIQTRSNMDEAVRSVSARAGALEQFAPVRAQMENINELHEMCQTQYAECMDMFCNVVDDTMGRCSCSSNYSNYNRVARAAAAANTELNEVAQRIRYIGLTPEEIEVMNSGTVAEEEMASKTDKSDMSAALKDIAAMIKDPSQISSSYAENATGILDLDLTFSSNLVDLSGINLMGTASEDARASNKRGVALYETAKNHCKHILTQCVDAGGDAEQITMAYDINIDKDCMSYAASLEKQNETIKNNVRSAETMLQSARTAVAQNKNQYDAKNCVAALNICMTDDYVCGGNYYNCVDPTNTYIDNSGEIILGRSPQRPLAYMKKFAAATINKDFLTKSYALTSITDAVCLSDTNNNGMCIANKLLNLIGMGDTSQDGGLCRHVLDQCQDITYDENGTYDPYNEVVVSYVRYAMTQINEAQQKLVGDYAATCLADVETCIDRQMGYMNAWGDGADIESLYRVVRGACRNVALTCGYAAFDYSAYSDFTMVDPNTGERTAGCDTSSCGGNQSCINDKYITCIANVAMQDVLCPGDSTFTSVAGTAGTGGYVNSHCVCDSGFIPNPTTGYCDMINSGN